VASSSHPSVQDLEWQVILKSGRVRQEFDRLRQLLTQAQQERDAALAELTRLRSEARVAAPTAPQARAPRQASTPRVQEAQPVVGAIEEKPTETASDDTAMRFSLLELD
jgi:hypothetical protein